MVWREQVEDTWYDFKSFVKLVAKSPYILGLLASTVLWGVIFQSNKKPTLFQGKVTAIVDGRVQGSDSKEFPYELDVRLQSGEIVTVKARNIVGAEIGHEIEINVFVSDDDKDEKTYRYYPPVTKHNDGVNN